ncbi:MAG: MerR family transcriptional regulator, partial [Verrucomicrobiota bacterium]|nr:MerR family transcriptional regulator [Verrucomicrobiota bacterium]
MTKPHHSIRIASSRSGVSQHVIRVWEKRYSAVEPERTATNRRLYSDAEIERLVLLRLATSAGHSIGNVARLRTDRLKQLVAEATGERPSDAAKIPAQAFHDACLESVKSLSAKQLEENLQRALVALGHQGLLRQVVAPLAHTVGERWRAGSITAAHEHFLTASLKVFLGNTAGQFATSSVAPTIVVATPAGQLHELGALMINA